MKLSIQSILPAIGLFILAIALVGFVCGKAHKAQAEMTTGHHAVVGETVPDFTLTDTNGVSHNLSDFKGKNVVLEWTNHKCPYVVKHYKTGNMQDLQKEATNNGVVWLTIVSSAEGEQGYVTAEEGNALIAEQQSQATAMLLDVSGTAGKTFGAKVTPHMYIIDANGKLAYAGAIDDRPSTNPKTIEGATNYVKAALGNLMVGEPVETASTQPYGCSVKYKKY